MGLGLAVELGLRAVPVTVVEKESILHRIPKGQNLTQRTMEHFRSWGIEDDIRRARVMPSDYPAVGINAYADLMSDYAHPWFRRSEVDSFYFASNERIPQYLTERVLRARIDQLPSVTALFGVRSESIHREGARVIVTTDQGPIEAEYVVGCDGSRSMVREQAGIEETRSDHDQKMVLLVFSSTELHHILEDRFGQASFFNVLHPDLGGYWRFLGRVDVGESWFFHAPVPEDTTVAGFDHEGLLHATVGAEFDAELDYIGFWDLRIAIAETYRAGRVFIAGDAAHSHPPYGGYGINTGLEDVRNLGWKLGAALSGWAGEGLLDSYDAERRPVFVSTARDFIEAFIENDREFIGKYDPRVDERRFAEAWERRRSGSNLGVSVFEPNYEGSPIVTGASGGSPSAVGTHSLEARAGHHLPPPSASPPDELFAALGRGLSLITTQTARAGAEAFSTAAEELGIPLRVVHGSEADMESYGCSLILVRPDHFISWVDDGSPYQESEVLARSVGSPEAT